jgi:hypothetical protein
MEILHRVSSPNMVLGKGIHSPYLFLLCAKGFSALLQEAERDGRIAGVKVCHTAPSVSHLLDLYERCSGQMINKGKVGYLIQQKYEFYM